MNNMVEAGLLKKGEEYKHIEAPEEMEIRLRQALQGRKGKISFKPVAAALLALLLFSYSFDTLAYYGTKFMGYDKLTLGSLKQLNEEDQGQKIGESRTFSNGVTVTIDGIMFDENNLVTFYKVQSNGEESLMDILGHNLPRLHAYGIKPGGYYSTYGHGIYVDDHNMTFVDTLKAPGFFEKWMKFEISLLIDNKWEQQTINFTLDRDKAAQRTAKLALNSEAKLGDYRIIFDNLSATTMSTVLSGKIVALTDDALSLFDAKNAEASFEIPTLHFDIISDKGEVCQFSGNQSVSGSDIRFSSNSDALPKDFKSLVIDNIRLESIKLVDKTIEISKATKDMQISEDLIIKEVYQDDNITNLVLISRGIPVVGLFDGDMQMEQINSEEFSNPGLDTMDESTQPTEIVYSFKNIDNANKTDWKLELSVKYNRYTKYSRDIINIPIE